MASNNGRKSLGPIALKMFTILADGKPHRREELRECLYEQDAPNVNIRQHILALNKSLAPFCERIVCVARQNTHFYQLVKLVTPSQASSFT